MEAYILSTKRLGLRRWMEKDIIPFIEMNKDAEVMQYFPNILTGQETKEMLQRINLQFEKNNFGLFAVEDKKTKEFVGFAGFNIPAFDMFFTPCIEIDGVIERRYGDKALQLRRPMPACNTGLIHWALKE